MREEVQSLEPSRHWRFTTENYDTLLPPEPLAEHLEPQIAVAGMRHCMTLRKAEGHFHSAWHHVEYALNQSAKELDDELRRKYIGDASYLIAKLTNANGEAASKFSPNLYAQAMTLNIYLPLFTKRALNMQASRNDCSDVYKSFGSLFNSLQHMNDSDSSYKPARFAEMIGFALSARSLQPEILLYPASPREEASMKQSINHDGYFIRDGRKLPIQSKLSSTEKYYTAPTSVMYIEPLAEHALKRSGLLPDEDTLDFGESTLYIVDLITEELTDPYPDGRTINALNFMTRSIAGRYKYFSSEYLTA